MCTESYSVLTKIRFRKVCGGFGLVVQDLDLHLKGHRLKSCFLVEVAVDNVNVLTEKCQIVCLVLTVNFLF